VLASSPSVPTAAHGKRKRVIAAPDPPSSFYRCMENGCGRTFTEKSNLLFHRRAIHTDRDAFICPVIECQKSFSYKHVRNRHLNTVHGFSLEEARQLVAKAAVKTEVKTEVKAVAMAVADKLVADRTVLVKAEDEAVKTEADTTQATPLAPSAA
jgi:hypothetical protein